MKRSISQMSTTTAETQPCSRSNFRVAIVCALKIESDAVMAMFDNDWDASILGRIPNDTNEYSIGRIGIHDVVLVHLPGMGTNSAAASINSLRTAYQNIELALLVGICGAAPNTNDGEIILGDVVISDNIAQYDYGSKYPHRLQQKTEAADRLPRHGPRMRTFLHKMDTLQGRTRLQQNMRVHLSRVLEQPDFSSWVRPATTTDRLFDAQYRHKHQSSGICNTCDSCKGDRDETCEEALKAPCVVLGCSDEYSMPRERILAAIQNNTQLDPKVHFGIAASGNQVMKSAIDRDEISGRENVIAFEMEGAGLWDYIPTLIVKGVCDYSDSHKNKDWQKYACIAAASYMKALLHEWRDVVLAEQPQTMDSTLDTPQGRDQTRKIIDTLWFREIADRFDGIAAAQFDSFKWIFHQEKTPLLQCKSTRGEHLKLDPGLEWDPCQLKAWLRNGEGVFWITGKLGCGKSTLMKLVYEDDQYTYLLRQWANGYTLLTPSFFFWRAGSDMQKSHRALLQSILHQLLKSHPELISRILEPVEQEDIIFMDGTERESMQPLWTLDRAQRLFQKLIRLENVKMCILLDGLDEMDIQHAYMADYLTQLTQNCNVKVLVSGRYLSEFSASFYGCPTIHLHDWTLHDAEIYVRGRLLSNRFLCEQAEEFREDFKRVVRLVLDRAEGVFIWIKTAVNALIEGIYKCDTLSELENRLAELPAELNELYETILSSLDKRYETHTRFCLGLISASQSSRDHSVASVISLAYQYNPMQPDWLSQQSSRSDQSIKRLQAWTRRRLESYCSQLILFRDDPLFNWRVSFVHATVFDFLQTPNMRAWISAGIPDTYCFDTAFTMAELTSAILGDAFAIWGYLPPCSRANRQCVFLEKMSVLNTLPFAGNNPMTHCEILALRQVEAAILKEARNDSDFPLRTPTEIDILFDDTDFLKDNSFFKTIRICDPRDGNGMNYIGASYLIDIWSKNRKSQRDAAFPCLLLLNREMAAVVRSYLESGACNLNTEDRVDILTIHICSVGFVYDSNSHSSNLIHYLCSQDATCVGLFWERIILMLSCLADISNESLQQRRPELLKSGLKFVIRYLLAQGADPNVYVRCSPAALQKTVFQSPLRVLRRCEALGSIEVPRIIEILLGYGALDLEKASSDLLPRLEEVMLIGTLAECKTGLALSGKWA